MTLCVCVCVCVCVEVIMDTTRERYKRRHTYTHRSSTHIYTQAHTGAARAHTHAFSLTHKKGAETHRRPRGATKTPQQYLLASFASPHALSRPFSALRQTLVSCSSATPETLSLPCNMYHAYHVCIDISCYSISLDQPRVFAHQMYVCMCVRMSVCLSVCLSLSLSLSLSLCMPIILPLCFPSLLVPPHIIKFYSRMPHALLFQNVFILCTV